MFEYVNLYNFDGEIIISLNLDSINVLTINPDKIAILFKSGQWQLFNNDDDKLFEYLREQLQEALEHTSESNMDFDCGNN